MIFKPIENFKSRYLRQGLFTTNVLTLMTGTTIAQAIPLAISPILTRVYGPEAFGIFALYGSIASILSIIVTGRYELAIMLPEKDEDAVNIVALSLIIACFISFIALIIVLVFNESITNLLGNKEVSKWLYFIPATVLFTGIYNTFNYWSNRKKQYRRLAVSRVSQSGATATAQLGMGFGGLGSAGLVCGSIIGQGVATGVLGWQVWREDKNKKRLISKEIMLKNMKEYESFPKINSFHAFIDTLQASGVVFLISHFFGGVILGFYSLTLRVLRSPVTFMGASISQVFFQKASETYNNRGNLQLIVEKILIRLSLISLPIFAILFLFGPDIFSVVFGENWREAGAYSRILTPWILLDFIASPLSIVPIIVNKQKEGFIIGIIYNVFIFVPLLLAVYMGKGIILGLQLLSFFATAILICYIFWIINISKKRVDVVCNNI